MIVRTRWVLAGVSLLSCARVLAMTPAEARQYCEEIHPAEYYEPAERKAYVEQCVVDYTDSSDAGDDSWGRGNLEPEAEQDMGRDDPDADRSGEPPEE